MNLEHVVVTVEGTLRSLDGRLVVELRDPPESKGCIVRSLRALAEEYQLLGRQVRIVFTTEDKPPRIDPDLDRRAEKLRERCGLKATQPGYVSP